MRFLNFISVSIGVGSTVIPHVEISRFARNNNGEESPDQHLIRFLFD